MNDDQIVLPLLDVDNGCPEKLELDSDRPKKKHKSDEDKKPYNTSKAGGEDKSGAKKQNSSEMKSWEFEDPSTRASVKVRAEHQPTSTFRLPFSVRARSSL